MKRALVLLLALCLFAAIPYSGAESDPAAEELPTVATPTDLECAHEQTHSVYYFDEPWYTPYNAFYHRVSGSATVQTVCDECGEVLSTRYRESVSVNRRHSFKKGVCILCGQVETGAANVNRDAPGERTVFFPPEEVGEAGEPLLLTRKDLQTLKNEEIEWLILRSADGETAIAMGVQEALERVEKRNPDAFLYAQLLPSEDEGMRTELAIGLREPDGKESLTAWDGSGDPEEVMLRFYRENADHLTLMPEGESALDAIWVDRDAPLEGFWTVPWSGNGAFKLQ